MLEIHFTRNYWLSDIFTISYYSTWAG